MPLIAARASRNVAVRLTAMTLSQSSSRNCTNKLSLGDAGIGDKDVELSHRLLRLLGPELLDFVLVAQDWQGKTCTRSPSDVANWSSASFRVPEIATVAPCACKACAIAPPMPPVAPVTNAVLPFKSNIMCPFSRALP